MQGTYALFLRARKRWLGSSARSYLQDTVLVLLPTYAPASRLLGNQLAAAMDFAGLALPLGLTFLRVGCFLGGCCYGRPSPLGIIYPPHVLRAVAGWRPYTPGQPTGRVLPTQLVEAAFNALFFAVLATRAFQTNRASGRLLPVYLGCYAAQRFVLDFWRQDSARRRIGRFSQAQIASLIVILACSLLLVFLETFARGVQ
jgi:phosphatidylglycerol:prolipoprotein diacylglycerol transferase